MYGYLECHIEGQNIIVAGAIVGKVPKEGSDSYDLIVGDHFVECDQNKKWVIEEYIPFDTKDLNTLRKYLIILYDSLEESGNDGGVIAEIESLEREIIRLLLDKDFILK